MENKIKQIKIILIKSVIGSSKRQKETIKSLGLNKINSQKIHKLTNDIEGKIKKISHLVKIEKI